MSLSSRVASFISHEGGAVLVTFALFAPVMILMAGFTIDAGNWFVHKRHLQVQADAAAFAAAREFQPCSNEHVYERAGQYGGASSVKTPSGTTLSSAPLFNEQVAGVAQSAIHELINSQRYYSQPTPVDSTAVETPPCSAAMVDVKMTETNLPWYWRAFSSVPFINAHARVEILQQITDKGTLPVAVNNFAPRSAEAYFVDESVSPPTQLMTCGPTGTSPCSVALKSDGTVEGESVWDNASTAFSFAVQKPNVGVRVAVSGRTGLTGTMSTDCAKTLVECFDAGASKVGVLHIQGYSGLGTATASSPIVRQAQLTGAPAGCSDGYFSNSASTCSLALTATVDWGSATKPTGADVDAVVNGICYALTFQSFSGTNEVWSSASAAPASSCSNFKANKTAGTGFIPLASGTGALQINLQAKDSAATKEFTAVQRSYAASTTTSGLLHKAFLGQVGGTARDADSFRMCEAGNTGAACTPGLVVTLYLAGSLQNAQSVSDPVYTMRFTGTGSQNQSVTCEAVNKGANYAAALASGCVGTWGVNQRLECPDTTNPQDCVAPATGNKENQVAKGMNQRILGAEKPALCTSPNHWKEFTFTNGIPSVSPSDPRVVTVFVTPYGSFGGSGSSSEFPIALFASFYVTGWQDNGNGFNNPCQGNGDDTAQPGTIVGHFIKYIDTINNEAGESKCTLESLGKCIVVLTR